MRPFAYLRYDTALMPARDAKFLAGGTTLIDLMKLNVETPSQVIDLVTFDHPGSHEIVQDDHVSE